MYVSLTCVCSILVLRSFALSGPRTSKTHPSHTATHCNTLQHHTAAHCNTLLQGPLELTSASLFKISSATQCNITLQQYTATTHCNIPQRTATHRNILQHTNTLQRTATHCNALQRPATPCNALQRPATPSCRCHLRHQAPRNSKFHPSHTATHGNTL